MKIFLLDNDEQLLDTIKRKAEGAGFEVIAFTRWEGLSPEKLASEKFDLALVDRRFNDHDREDIRGEAFAISLHGFGVPTFLLTQFPPTSERIFELIWTEQLAGIFVKDKVDGDQFVPCLRAFARSRRAPNGLADFIFNPVPNTSQNVWVTLAELLGLPIDDRDGRLELIELFRLLIPPFVEEVSLKIIPKGKGGAALLKAIISMGKGSVRQVLALKYGPKEIIRSEMMRYDRFIGPLADGVGAQLRFRSETNRFGAIAYSWVSDSVRESEKFGPTVVGPGAWETRQRIIDRLFKVSLNDWFRAFRDGGGASGEATNLVKYYSQADVLWGQEVASLKDLNLPSPSNLPEFTVSADENSWTFSNKLIKPNPINWFATGPGNALTFQGRAPSHGDLHAANIFILPDGTPRLIDFGRTGYGHAFRDFAALECSIRFCSIDLSQSSAESLEAVLSRVKTLGDAIDTSKSDLNTQEISDLIKTIVVIRRLAWDTIYANSGKALVEYFAALVLHMFRYAAGTADELSPEKELLSRDLRKWRAHFAAACTVETLQQM